MKKHAITYAGGSWHWESKFGTGAEDTRDGAEQEYVKSFLKNKQEPDYRHVLMVTKEDESWLMEELKKERRKK
jgi:hypothetical protein